jgi:hypothetical protein
MRWCPPASDCCTWPPAETDQSHAKGRRVTGSGPLTARVCSRTYRSRRSYRSRNARWSTLGILLLPSGWPGRSSRGRGAGTGVEHHAASRLHVPPPCSKDDSGEVPRHARVEIRLRFRGSSAAGLLSFRTFGSYGFAGRPTETTYPLRHRVFETRAGTRWDFNGSDRSGVGPTPLLSSPVTVDAVV